MEFTYEKLKRYAIIYISLPVMLFFLGWIKLWISIPIVILFLLAFYKIMKKRKDEQEEVLRIKKSTFFIIGGIALLWCFLAGQGGFFYQSDDHTYRNALFRDLIQYDWPVIYPEYNRALVYYIGHWMLPAAIGKLGLWITGNTQIAWQIGNIVLLIWSTIGITIVFSLLVNFIKAASKKKVILTLLVMIFFSGLDIIGSLILGTYDATHLEWWGGAFQISSITTCLFWVFNQAIIPWMITLMVMQEKRLENYAYLAVMGLLSGPLPTIGIAIYLAGFGIASLVKHIKEKSMKEFWKQCFSFQNVFAVIAILPIIGLYLTSNTAIGNGIHISMTGKPSTEFWINLSHYLLFLFLEVGVYAIVIWKENKKNLIYYLTVIPLLIIPVVRMGTASDFSMRASIPGILVLMVLVLKYLFKNYKVKKFSCMILTILLLIGAVTPFVEYRRAFTRVLQEKRLAVTIDTIKTFNQEDFRMKENFVTEQYQDKLFYRYLAK